MIELIETKNISQTNNLIKAAGVWVAHQLGLKKYEGGKKRDPLEKTYWRRYKAAEKGHQHSRKGKEKGKLVYAKTVRLN